jgi:hypothetical protein
MNSEDFAMPEKFNTPQVGVEITGEGFSIYEANSKYGISVKDNAGTAEDPYEIFYSSNLDPIMVSSLFFSFANLDPSAPKDIYADINTVVFRFCPAEALPIKIYKLRSELHREQAVDLERRMLEAIKPGLSGILDL